jgi:hypothetical protein
LTLLFVICVSGECRTSSDVFPNPSQPTFASAPDRAEAEVRRVHAAAAASRRVRTEERGRRGVRGRS